MKKKMTCGERIDAAIDAKLRRACGVINHQVAIVRVAGDAAPIITGQEGGHYVRTSGQRIAHPSAYGRVGWSSMVYRCDTRVIIVGKTHKDES